MDCRIGCIRFSSWWRALDEKARVSRFWDVAPFGYGYPGSALRTLPVSGRCMRNHMELRYREEGMNYEKQIMHGYAAIPMGANDNPSFSGLTLNDNTLLLWKRPGRQGNRMGWQLSMRTGL